MKRGTQMLLYLGLTCLFITLILPNLSVATDIPDLSAELPKIEVSPDGHFLRTKDGAPFFWLGDTAWELFARLTREEVLTYLDNRREKGFTVIQAVIVTEHSQGGLGGNRYGESCFIDEDPFQPNEAYFQHVDFVLDAIASRGMYVCLLPTWGEWVTPRKSKIVFDSGEEGYFYGHFLGTRYRDRTNILWCLGGDRHPDERPWGMTVWRAMAEGITDGVNDENQYDKNADYSNTFMTWHSYGSSSQFFQQEPWLDAHSWGSYHMIRGAAESYRQAKTDWNLKDPYPRPTLNSEPAYENMAVNWKIELGRFNDFDVRQIAYWSVFAGCHGHTYGCHSIWEFTSGWKEDLDLPGAGQVRYLKDLMLSRPFFSRIPDQNILASPEGLGKKHMQATRDAEGTYLFVYIPAGTTVSIKMEYIQGKEVKGYWFNPRDGSSQVIGTFSNTGVKSFTPPEGKGENDWVLVLDDIAKNYPPPGEKD